VAGSCEVALASHVKLCSMEVDNNKKSETVCQQGVQCTEQTLLGEVNGQGAQWVFRSSPRRRVILNSP
jgi:hypothetical protein